MNDHAFADAARPTQVVCLRLPLRPYSLGHEILLLQQRNPLLTLSLTAFGELSFADQRKAIIRAVLICSNSWRQNQQPQKWLWLWRWKLKKIDWRVELVELRNYLFASKTSFPGPDPEADTICAKAIGYTPLKENRGRASGAPLMARLLQFVSGLDISRFGAECFYDFPFALANMLYETALEAEGAARIENQDELEEKEHLRKMRADAAAERRAQPEPTLVNATGLATPPPDLKGAE